MKKLFTMVSFLLSTIFLFGQDIHRLTPLDQRTQKINVKEEMRQDRYSAEPLLPAAQHIATQAPILRSEKTSGTTNSPVQLGSASNIYTCLRVQQNQVYVDNDLDLVAFIHRQNVNVWGGGNAANGMLRVDVSVDGGNSFTTEMGPLNPTYTRPARYPNLTGFNPDNATNPFNSFLAYSAPTLNSGPAWDGHVTGMLPVTTSPPVQSTENYSLLSSQTFLQGGLCEGEDDEFWTVELQYDGAAFPGDIYLNKGVYNSSLSDIQWNRYDTISPSHYIGYDGTPAILSPNISFSPDGNTGWMAWLGDIDGGPDSTLQPIFIKSTDGGDTWGSPIEVDLNSDPAVAQHLQELWTQVDPVTGDTVPSSTGRATTFLDYDITVDMNGNPHMAVVIGSGASYDNPDPGYDIYFGLSKFLADVWSPDGGATWKITYIAPILTFRGSFGTTDPVTMDNYCQISRTASGDHIFYSWVDSDTSATTGSMNGIGFGIADNLAPNLRISAMRVADEFQRCYIRVQDGDFLWDGKMLYPTLAPEVIHNTTTNEVSFPIVVAEMLNNEPLDPVQFWYFGTDAVIDIDTGFLPPSLLDLSWDATPCKLGVGIEDKGNDKIVLGQSAPNPTNGEANIEFKLPYSAEVFMDVTNSFGQQVMVLANETYSAGKHSIRVNTSELAAGIYFYNLRVGDKIISKKMVITKR